MTEQRPNGQRSHTGSGKEPTHEQVSAAQVLSFLEARNTVQRRARKHHGWRAHRPLRHRREVKRTTNAVIDLYVLQTNHLPLDEFKEKWKEKAAEYQQLLTEVQPSIDLQNEEIFRLAPHISHDDRKEVTKAALRKLLNRNHRKNLITMAGYSEEERKEQRGKFVKSGVLAAGTGVGANIIVGGAIASEVASPMIEYGPIYDWKTLGVVALSYALHYGSIYVNNKVNYQLLKTPSIKTSPSIGATAAYYTTTELLPEDKKLTKRAVWTGTAFPALWQEPGLVAGLAIPVVGPLAAVGRNIGGTIFNTAEAAASTAYLGYRKVKEVIKKKRQERKTRKQVES